jgi:Uma2 family endonuclease
MENAMTMLKTICWTVDDLDILPDEEGTRYEIIDGEVSVAHQPHWHHQITCSNIDFELASWSRSTGLGRTIPAPGIVYDEDEAAVPDIVRVSAERLSSLLDPDNGKLHHSPDLVIEVLSPGTANEQRDHETKLKLYARRGVQEYWIADWRNRTLTIHRRQGDRLETIATLREGNDVTSPLLPGFACPLNRFFEI